MVMMVIVIDSGRDDTTAGGDGTIRIVITI